MKQSGGRKRVQSGCFRIIGGLWRGRRLDFAENRQVRPTPDRVRETLFNWLQPSIDGADCLDLYAGSGALGLEALSRGAASCVFVDRDGATLATIQKNIETLGCDTATLYRSDAQTWLSGPRAGFDVIFLDPPFELQPWDTVLNTIDQSGLLKTGGRVYMENLANNGPPPLPAGWQMLRQKRAGRVGYYLASRSPPEPE